ncbi:MAG TPA: GIY-YIG nuclease family protein [bacterium (Candidatus Stahlbacteria)]|nr:GIY-YIG nuclease family protein [Candidatus Stahlbacteria bacterium]
MVGRLGRRIFPRGIYFYVGSAKGGIEARVRRHLHRRKFHWHIDYLLDQGEVLGAGFVESGIECDLASALKLRMRSIPGFGASDCGCDSHLFYLEV